MNIALFASGNGSNVETILSQIQQNNLPINPVCLVCNNPDAKVIERAKKYDVPVFVESSKGQSRAEWEKSVLEYLEPLEIDYIVLAGFMRLLSEGFLAHYSKQVLNIHPSLLPKYPGIHSIEEAYETGESETGVTIFYVDEGVDTGQIIRQESLAINPNWTLEELEEAVHQLEHYLYIDVLQMLANTEGT